MVAYWIHCPESCFSDLTMYLSNHRLSVDIELLIFFFLWIRLSVACMDHYLFNQLPIGGHLGHFKALTTAHKATVNVRTCSIATCERITVKINS